MSSFCVAPNYMRAASPVTPHRLLFFCRRRRLVFMSQPHLCLALVGAMESLPSCGAGGHDASWHCKIVLCHWQGERIGRVGALTCRVRCELAGSVASRSPRHVRRPGRVSQRTAFFDPYDTLCTRVLRARFRDLRRAPDYDLRALSLCFVLHAS